MPHTSFTITPDGGDTITFAPLVCAVGRYALDLRCHALELMLQHEHPSGTLGSYVVNHGPVSQDITIETIYLGTNAQATYHADAAAVLGKICTIADLHSGITHDRLLLADEWPISMYKKISGIAADEPPFMILVARALFRKT